MRAPSSVDAPFHSTLSGAASRRLQRPKPSCATTSRPAPAPAWPRTNSRSTFSPTTPNSQTPSLTKVGMSSSRTNRRSAGKFSTRAASSLRPFWMRRPASWRRPRLSSDRRPDFWMAMWSRSSSTSIAASPRFAGGGVEGLAVAAIGLLAQKAGDADDGGGADPGGLVDLAVGEAGAVEQARDVPALAQGADLGRGAQIGEEARHLLAAAGGEQGGAERVAEPRGIASRLGRGRGGGGRILFHRANTL